MAETPILKWKYPDDYQPDWYLGPNGHVQLFTAIDAAVAGVPSIKNVKAFGAIGDGITDDTVAIQAAMDSAATGQGFGVGEMIFFPSGRYMVSDEIIVSRQITVAGCGPMSEIRQTNSTKSILKITAPGTNPPYGPQPNISSRQVTVRDLALSYVTPATAGACIFVDPGGPTGFYGNMTYGHRYLHLDMRGGYDGIHFERGAYFLIDGCFISGCFRSSVWIDNITSPYSGDSIISNCLFIDTSEADQIDGHIYWRTGGGLRLSNCKGMWGKYFINADINQETSSATISNCSVGGMWGGIKLKGSGTSFIGVSITGCGFDNDTVAGITPPGGLLSQIYIGDGFQNVSIVGNYFYLASNGHTGVKIEGAGIQIVNISGNQFLDYLNADVTGVYVGPTVQKVTINGNAFTGTFRKRLVNNATYGEVHFYDGAGAISMVSAETAINNTTANVGFAKSINIPPNMLDHIGAIVRFRAGGHFNCIAGSLQVNFQIRLQNTYNINIYPIGVTGPQTNGVWSIETYATVAGIGTTGYLEIAGGTGGMTGSAVQQVASVGPMNLDLTSTINVICTIQMSVANPGDIFWLRTFSVDVTPAMTGTV